MNHTPPEHRDALQQLSPALKKVLDAELRRGNRVTDALEEGPFVEVVLADPIDFGAHRVPDHVGRFSCAPREAGEPPLAGYGDDETGHTLAGPDTSSTAAVATPDTAAARNRRLSSDAPAAVEWHPDDSATLSKLKRTAQRFKWSSVPSVQAASDVMLVLFALDRDAEATALATFLSGREFDGDVERFTPVEPALALLVRKARAGGQAAAAEAAQAKLAQGTQDELRLEGALLEEARENAQLQRAGSSARREWELRWLAEALVLDALLPEDAGRTDELAASKAAVAAGWS